ncbi:hypothetical protein FF38_10206 [Lucilia cuprina]|uniref:Uncharacterized protein n=1 Tax=Lucilia cuprina TaxID=7375 RepID=A0A0L0C5J6_LUCCU|nr:hypothetical protein FF38_10206 [Lucilia cuprina]
MSKSIQPASQPASHHHEHHACPPMNDWDVSSLSRTVCRDFKLVISFHSSDIPWNDLTWGRIRKPHNQILRVASYPQDNVSWLRLLQVIPRACGLNPNKQEEDRMNMLVVLLLLVHSHTVFSDNAVTADEDDYYDDDYIVLFLLMLLNSGNKHQELTATNREEVNENKEKTHKP